MPQIFQANDNFLFQALVVGCNKNDVLIKSLEKGEMPDLLKDIDYDLRWFSGELSEGWEEKREAGNSFLEKKDADASLYQVLRVDLWPMEEAQWQVVLGARS